MLELEPESTAIDQDSGVNSRAWFARYDRASSSWRTSQGCLFAGWDEYSETWPRSGTTRNGVAYERPTSARRIDDCASLSWPTPTESDAGGAGNRNLPGLNAHPGLSLTDVVTGGQAPRTWPTPQSRDHKGSDLPTRHGGASLPHYVQTGERVHWPTPNTGDGTRGSDTTANREGSPSLTGAVHGLPDPANRSTHGNRRASSVVLNPAWVSCLMGLPPDWCDIGDVPLPRSGTR